MRQIARNRNSSVFGLLSSTAACMVLVAGCATGVRPDDFQRHVKVLASDEFGGRGIGSPGIDMAAGYIAGQFAALGIEPGGLDGTYFQVFELTTGSKLSGDHEFSLSGMDATPVRQDDYIPFPFSNNDSFDADMVFAGYGIVNEDKGHDDYKDFDVTDKVVLMLRREPDSWSDDGRASRHAMFRSKVYTAREQAAAAVLIVDRAEDDERPMRFRSGRGGGSANFGMPVFHVTRALAGKLLAAGGLASLSELQSKLDAGSFTSAPLDGVRLRGKAGITQEKTLARNVVGLIRGEGPLADEYIVIGGHYDHLGKAVPRRGFGGGGQSREPEIHNGADDNASGTAGVIEAGRILVGMKPLKRSVLLVTFTGEETGLHGSRRFVDDPPVSLDSIVAMLNMDMIGRIDKEKNTLTIFGTKAAEEFEEMITRLTRKSGFALRPDASAMGPSDHTSFYQKKIPSIHFFSGLHSDYHRPGDDANKVNYEDGARVTDLVVAIANEIISNDARPTYHEVTARARISGRGDPGGRPRVVMGVMPGYADSGDEKGMRIDGVSDGGPAAKAGMKSDDRIIKIGNVTVNNIYDYMGALRNAKVGDVVDVVVVRGGTDVAIKVTLVGG